MATDGSGTPPEENDEPVSSDLELSGHIPKRHARVTVKYNRKELQRRLDLEKWIDESLDQLYRGQVGPAAALAPLHAAASLSLSYLIRTGAEMQ